MGMGKGWLRGLIGVLALSLGLAAPVHGSIPEDHGPLWAARYEGPGNNYDFGDSIAVSPDGSKVFVTGSSLGLDTNYDSATVAYTASGVQLWATRFNGPANYTDGTNSIVVSPDGSKVFVAGWSAGLDGVVDFEDYITLAYKADDGSQLWAARYNGPANGWDVAMSIAVSPDGSKVYVTGDSAGSGSDQGDYATVAYAAVDGSQLWAARYNGPGNSTDFTYTVAVSPDGSKVFVNGWSIGSGSSNDYATLAYAAEEGTQLWAARYNGPGNGYDVAYSLAVSPDGSKIFITGGSADLYNRSTDYATVAYAAEDGAQLWVARYNGLPEAQDYGFSVAVSPDGSKVFVTGSSGSNTINFVYHDYATVAYATADGAQLWAVGYNGSGDARDIGHSVAVSLDGSKIFVTGESAGSGSSMDYATVAYAADDGVQLWVARYNGPANSADRADTVEVSPNGSEIFVTGWSTGSGSSYDYATVAYRTSSCSNGSDETGPVSGVVHEVVEPSTGPAVPYVHGVNCDVVAANGL